MGVSCALAYLQQPCCDKRVNDLRCPLLVPLPIVLHCWLTHIHEYSIQTDTHGYKMHVYKRKSRENIFLTDPSLSFVYKDFLFPRGCGSMWLVRRHWSSFLPPRLRPPLPVCPLAWQVAVTVGTGKRIWSQPQTTRFFPLKQRANLHFRIFCLLDDSGVLKRANERERMSDRLPPAEDYISYSWGVNYGI